VWRDDAARFLERGARALMVKPGRIGLSESRAIAALCGARGAQVSLGMYYESALGTAFALQCAGALASRFILPAEHSFFLMLAEQVVGVPLEVTKGRLRLPEEPDLRRLVDWRALERRGAELRP
ncbi:MAG TPA: enolase C-terminal domain-like protein, partial [Burkholderiales bacterium]|nr:enolase C-terminal domain-like protein [Burkholderiales bacterium]